MALDSCEPTEDEKLNQNEDQKLIGDLNNAIKCCDCHATINDKDLFWCLNCNRKRIFCDECGKSMHLTTKHQHQYQVQAVKKINLVDIENLTKDGHDILTNYRNLSWYMRKSLAISIAENIVRKCPIGVMMARLVSKQLITSASRVASNITLNALCAGIGTGVVIAVEMGYHFYMWHKGNIDKQELKRRLVKTVATGIPTGAACFGGAVLGAAIGSLAGPVGSIIGAIVGGLIAATIAGVGADKVFERYFPSNEKKAKAMMIREAFARFSLNIEDRKDPNKFNKKKIRGIYKELAKTFHPDRPNGSTEQFQTLGVCYGILMSLLDCEQDFIDRDVVVSMFAIKV